MTGVSHLLYVRCICFRRWIIPTSMSVKNVTIKKPSEGDRKPKFVFNSRMRNTGHVTFPDRTIDTVCPWRFSSFFFSGT